MVIKVAVLICVYSGDNPSWFSQALESIIAQKTNDIQVNIYLGVDGEISPELDTIIASNSANLYHVAVSPVNCGLSHMLNLLIAQLEDEQYIFRMDADDICCLSRIQSQVEAMQSSPTLDILGGAITEFSSQGFEIQRSFPESAQFAKSQLYLCTPVAHVTVCFRRAALDKLGGYSTCSPFNEDIELWFRAFSLGMEIRSLPDVLVKVRVTLDFYKRRSFQKALTELKVYWHGCTLVYGWSYRHFFPLLRFVFRSLPSGVSKKIYESKVRKMYLES